MGITIHYRGRIDSTSRVASLCDELEDIAGAMKWKAHRLNDDYDREPDALLVKEDDSVVLEGHLGLKGVGISPGQGSETLDLFFDREGILRSPVSVALIHEGVLPSDNTWNSVKTQLAPVEVHAWIVGLLKYLKKHYIADLEVHDDGRYWETGDMDVLKKSRRVMDELFDRVEAALTAADRSPVEEMSAEEIAERIEEILGGLDER